MLYVLAVFLSIGLFAAFLLVTRMEARRGRRYFATERASLDVHVDRYTYVASHVDFPSFVHDTTRAVSARIVHDLVHVTLITVRFVERLLTRAVRSLREHRIRLHEERSENASDKE